jgi:hypothetical protein
MQCQKGAFHATPVPAENVFIIQTHWIVAGYVRSAAIHHGSIPHCYFHLLCAAGYDISKCIDRNGPNTASDVHGGAFQ